MSLGDYRQNMHVRLCDMLHDDPVANILMRVPEEHWSELCLLYLNDVLKSVHSVPHLKASDEYEVKFYCNYSQNTFAFPDIKESSSCSN